MSWILAAAAMVGAMAQTSDQPAKPIEVMVVGTYHFNNPGRDLYNPKVDDVLQPERQRELEAVAVALAEFAPTRIMVERLAAAPSLADPRYPAFTRALLGEQRDERVQIAYRIAHRLRHPIVYAIDEQAAAGEPDYFPFGKLASWAETNGAKARLEALMANGAAAAKHIEQLQKRTIPAALAEINRAEAGTSDHAFYYEALAIGDTEQQPGADLNAMWYLRNAKIFAKLQTAARPGDRVLVVYGSGHNYWLRHFAQMTPGYRNVDPVPYLEKANAALR